MSEILGLILTAFYIYCCCKISVRFGRHAIWGFLLVVPVIGYLIFWIIMSVTKVKEQSREDVANV